jgi:hypothetical protein
MSADDAKRVENAFAARMALPGGSPEALTTDEATSPPQPIQVSPNRPQHQRTPSSRGGKGGTPERSKPRPSNLLAPPVPLKSTIDNDSSTHLRADATLQKLRKASSRSASRADIVTNPSQVRRIAAVSGLWRRPADSHHLRFTQPRAMGRKVSDEFTVQLCRTHHRDNHRFGDEQVW